MKLNGKTANSVTDLAIAVPGYQIPEILSNCQECYGGELIILILFLNCSTTSFFTMCPPIALTYSLTIILLLAPLSMQVGTKLTELPHKSNISPWVVKQT